MAEAEYALDLTQDSWPLWTDRREGNLNFASFDGDTRKDYNVRLALIPYRGRDAVKMTVTPQPGRTVLNYILSVISEAADLPVHILE